MTVTLRIETAEGRPPSLPPPAQTAACCWFHGSTGRYASVGTLAEIQDADDDGNVVVSGLARARVGPGPPTTPAPCGWKPRPTPRWTSSTRNSTARGRVPGDRHRGAGAPGHGGGGRANPGDGESEPTRRPRRLLAGSESGPEGATARDPRHPPAPRLLLDWMREVLGTLELRRKVRDQAAENIDKSQREYLLRQQLEAIRKELGDETDAGSDYRAKLAERDLPRHVVEAVTRDIERLERMSEQSPEHSWIRTWLDTVFELPWENHTDDRLDLDEAWTVLDADHTGLRTSRSGSSSTWRSANSAERGSTRTTTATERSSSSSVPPGSARPRWASRCAKALGRSFVRVALGGVRDEAEVRGHRGPMSVRARVGSSVHWSRPGR
jgi:hypothetical protein